MNVEIAQRLAELRRARGYSQESLARELGLSRQAVSKWERAESSPDTDNLLMLAKLYGVSLDELLNVGADVADDVKFEAKDRAEAKQAEDAAASDRLADAVDAAVTASKAAAQAAEAAGKTVTAHAGAASAPAAKKRGPWRSFPYWAVALVAFVILLFTPYADVSWLAFVTIPIYNWVANILDEARERSAGDGSDTADPSAPSDGKTGA